MGLNEMKTHNFKLVNADTDSVTICKQDGSPISEEENEALIIELNSLFPEKIHFEADGEFRRVIVLKAKNYILDDGKKIKIKGSSLKDTKRSPALRLMIGEIVDDLLNDKGRLVEIYNRYVKEASNVQDMKRWATKKTVTESVLNPQRTNEQKVLDALKGTDYQQGDKRHFFYLDDEDSSLCLVERFDGINYKKNKLYENLYRTIVIFETIIETEAFPNYSLKKNKMKLDELLK